MVGRLSHESQNALENMYWGHMTQHVTHITVPSICQHHYGYIMSCSLTFALSHSHDGGIAQLGSSQAGASGGPFHRSRSCQGLSGLKLIDFCPHFYLFMIISHSCTCILALDLIHWYVVFTHSCVCLGPGPVCFHALSYMLSSFFPPAFAQLSESTCCFSHEGQLFGQKKRLR